MDSNFINKNKKEILSINKKIKKIKYINSEESNLFIFWFFCFFTVGVSSLAISSELFDYLNFNFFIRVILSVITGFTSIYFLNEISKKIMKKNGQKLLKGKSEEFKIAYKILFPNYEHIVFKFNKKTEEYINDFLNTLTEKERKIFIESKNYIYSEIDNEQLKEKIKDNLSNEEKEFLFKIISLKEINNKEKNDMLFEITMNSKNDNPIIQKEEIIIKNI